MIACSIIRDPKTKEVSRVLAPNGQDSTLFNSIKESISDKEEALKIWAYVYTDSFKQKFGDWEKLARINLTDPGIDEVTLKALATQFDEKLDDNGEPLLEEIENIAKESLESPFSETYQSLIQDKTTFGEPLIDNSPEVNYMFKAVVQLQDNLDKVLKWYKSIGNTDAFWKKVQQDLQIPKGQVDILRQLPGETIEEKLATFASKYSYTIEINIAKFLDEHLGSYDRFYLGEDYYTKIDTYRRNDIPITKDQYVKAISEYKKRMELSNTRHYANLTVPGGTNYTENEIATPAITPVIRGHAQFATDKGIGWFRSDDKAKSDKALVDGYFYYTENDGETTRFVKHSFNSFLNKNKEGKEYISAVEYGKAESKYNFSTKTRRILEMQSDLFQKGRDGEELSKVLVSEGLLYKLKNIGVDKGQKFNVKGTWFEVVDSKIEGSRVLYKVVNLTDPSKTSWATQEKIYNAVKEYYELKEPSNKFLQLLNKDNNWVTFFTKSIIQDSAKKGYKKVLFPKGDTASKVEGHTTLEEFKKQKEDRIKSLEVRVNELTIEEGVDGYWSVYDGTIQASSGITTEKQANEFLESRKVVMNNEITQLKQELERIEKEGFGALKPIYNFYENVVGNVLKKQGYSPKVVKDEYGNGWNEVDITPDSLNTIYFQKQDETQPNTEPDLELNEKINRFLEKIGVSVQSINAIRDINGRKLDVNAKADMLNRIIEVVEGREQLDTLPEEAAHFFVEMLGPNSPLYKEMYNKITGYKIYTATVEQYKNLKEYRNADGSINFDKLKKEAIGKLIAEHIIKLNFGEETDAKIGLAMSWWQKVWNFIKSLFNRAEENPFEQAAEEILEGDISLLDPSLELNEEYFQYSDPIGSLMADQDKINLDNTVDPRTDQKRHIYYYNGQQGKGSVTGIYVDKYLRKIFRSDERTDRQRVLDLVKADYGDIIHEEMKNIVDSWTNTDGTKRSVQMPIRTKLNPIMFKMLNGYVESLMNQYEKGTVFKSEVKIFDKKAMVGGSIDLLVVKPNMEVDIYDWKSTEVAKDATELKEYKETVFKIQLDEYRKILIKDYGFTKFGTIRAIPIRTQFNYAKGDIKSLKSLEIGSLDPTQIPEEKSYLLPVLLRNEPTGDKQLDALITRLNGIYDKIKNTRYSLSEINQKKEEIRILRGVLKDLQLRKRVDKLVELGMIEFKKYSDKLEKNTLSGKDIQEGLKILEVFSDSGVMLYDLMEEYAVDAEESDDKKAKSEYNKLNRRFLQMTSKVSGLMMQIKEYQKEQTVKLGEEKGILNVLDPESPVGTMPGLFQALSNIEQKSFRIFSKILRQAQGIRDTKFKDAVDKMQLLKNNFAKWASDKGLSNNKAMEMILSLDEKGNWNGNFLEKYNPEFSRLKKQALNKGDLKWLKENLQFDPFNQYQESLQRQKDYFNSIIYSADEEKNKKIVEEKIQDWIEQHNIIDAKGQLNMTALMNPRNYFLKPTDNWLSAKWNELYKKDAAGNYVNKPVVEMYEYFQELNRKAEELGMLDKYSPRFIPSVHAGKVENLVFGDAGSFLSLGKFFDELEVDSGTRYTPQIDPTDGSIINRIPVYFTRDMGVEKKNATGESYMDYSAKSRDLFKVYAIWANHVYNYEAMSTIEDDAVNLLEIERNKQSLVTDMFNNVVIEGGKVKAINNNDRNAKLLEEFMNFYLYDRTSGIVKDFKIKVPFTNKEYSFLKTVTAGIRYFSAKTLGLNLISASAQFVGGSGNALFTAQKGVFFTKTTWAKSMYITGSSKKALAALRYLNILQESKADTMIDALSLSTAGRALNTNNLFVVQRVADKGVQYPVAIALMLEHMVDPETGKIVSIQNYVKNKYNYNNNYYNLSDSEREAMKKAIDKEVGELQDTKSLFAISKLKEDGSFEIPGIDPYSETFLDFRDKIRGINKRIIGNQTRDDVNNIRTTLLGSALMQFRNWIPEMVEERISGLKYDDELQTWVYGKFNIFFGDVFSKRFPKLLKSIATGFGHDAEELAKMRYEALRAEFIEKGKEFNITEGEFIDLYIGSLKSQMSELIVLLAITAAVTAVTSAGDDDRRQSGLKKYLARALKKYYNEFAFYYNPLEFTRLIKNPIPVVGLVEDMYRFLGAVAGEGIGAATRDEERMEKNMPMKQLLKSIPIGKEFLLINAALDDDFRKEWNIRVDNYFYQ